jgi:hypothetical protein
MGYLRYQWTVWTRAWRDTRGWLGRTKLVFFTMLALVTITVGWWLSRGPVGNLLLATLLPAAGAIFLTFFLNLLLTPYRLHREQRAQIDELEKEAELQLIVRAVNLPEYLGKADDAGHIILIRDCVFTNRSSKDALSVQLHLGVIHASGGGVYYYDDPALPKPNGFLRNPINLGPRQSVRGHFALLLNPLIVPFAEKAGDFPKMFADRMKRDKVTLVIRDLISGDVTSVRLPTNA